MNKRQAWDGIWKGRVIVVTGVALLGSAVLRELVKKGAVVRVSYRKSATGKKKPKTIPGVQWMAGDLTDPAFCQRLCRGADGIVHLAAKRHNIAAHQEHSGVFAAENVTMAMHMGMSAAREPSVRFMIFSSTANIAPGMTPEHLLNMDPIDGYVAGKIASELLLTSICKEHGLPLLIVRPAGLYGVNDVFTRDSNIIPSLMVQARSHPTRLHIWGDGKQRRSFLFADDAARALLLLAERRVTGLQYLHTGSLVSIRSVAQHIRDIACPDATIQTDTTKPSGAASMRLPPVHPALRTMRWTPLAAGLKATYTAWTQAS